MIQAYMQQYIRHMHIMQVSMSNHMDICIYSSRHISHAFTLSLLHIHHCLVCVTLWNDDIYSELVVWLHLSDVSLNTHACGCIVACVRLFVCVYTWGGIQGDTISLTSIDDIIHKWWKCAIWFLRLHWHTTMLVSDSPLPQYSLFIGFPQTGQGCCPATPFHKYSVN